MKTQFLFLILCMATIANAQDSFNKGEKAITLGYGFPNLYARRLAEDLKNTDIQQKGLAIRYGAAFTYSASGFGPLLFKYDYAVSDELGIGFVLGYSDPRVTEKYSYSRSVYNGPTQSNVNKKFYQAITRRNTSFSIGARLNYHFGKKNKIDPYIGFAIGYTQNKLTETLTSDDPLMAGNLYSEDLYSDAWPLYLGATLGIRDYITDNIGVYLELGLDKWAPIQGGIAFKFAK